MASSADRSAEVSLGEAREGHRRGGRGRRSSRARTVAVALTQKGPELLAEFVEVVVESER
jgi:hypothetical protein